MITRVGSRDEEQPDPPTPARQGAADDGGEDTLAGGRRKHELKGFDRLLDARARSSMAGRRQPPVDRRVVLDEKKRRHMRCAAYSSTARSTSATRREQVSKLANARKRWLLVGAILGPGRKIAAASRDPGCWRDPQDDRDKARTKKVAPALPTQPPPLRPSLTPARRADLNCSQSEKIRSRLSPCIGG